MAFPFTRQLHSFTRIIICFIIYLLPFKSFSQSQTDKATITEGPEIKARLSGINDVFGYSQNGFYISHSKGFGLYIEHLNSNMAVDKSAKVPKQTSDEDNDMYYKSCVMMKGHIVMFSICWNDYRKVITLISQSVDTSTLLPDDHLTEISSVPFTNRPLTIDDIYNDDPFTIKLSEDGSYLAIYSDKTGMTKLGAEDALSLTSDIKFRLDVFNSEMKKTWDKEIEFPFSLEKSSMRFHGVDHEGNIIIDGIVEGSYQCYKYNSTINDHFEVPLDLTGKYISSLQTGIAKNGNIIICGLYFDVDPYNISGAFLIEIDAASHEIKKQKMSEIDRQFMVPDTIEFKKKGEHLIVKPYDLLLNDLLIRNDGCVILIAEQSRSHMVSIPHTDSNGNVIGYDSQAVYHFDNIFVFKFSSDGSLERKSKIIKRQLSNDNTGGFASYIYSESGDNLFFLYNDDLKNLSLQPDKHPTPQSECKDCHNPVIVLAEVASDGKVSQETLITLDAGKIVGIRPKKSIGINARELLILREGDKSYEFDRVILKNE